MYLIYFKQTSAVHSNSSLSWETVSFSSSLELTTVIPDSSRASRFFTILGLSRVLRDLVLLVLWRGDGCDDLKFSRCSLKGDLAKLMMEFWVDVGSKWRQSSQRNFRIGMRLLPCWRADSQYWRHSGKISYIEAILATAVKLMWASFPPLHTYSNPEYFCANSWKNVSTISTAPSSFTLLSPSHTPFTNCDRWARHSGTHGLTSMSEAASWMTTERTHLGSWDSERTSKTACKINNSFKL